MKCEEVLSLLNDYLDNELDEKTNKIIETHLDNCENCRKEMEEIKALKSVIKDYSLKSEEELCKKMNGLFKDVRVDLNKDKNFYNLKLLFCLLCVAISAMIIMNNIKENATENSNIHQATFILVEE